MRLTKERLHPPRRGPSMEDLRARRAVRPRLDAQGLAALLAAPPACGLPRGAPVRLRPGARTRVQLGDQVALVAGAVGDRVMLALLVDGRPRLVDVPARAVEAVE